jgi:hypothetical protein
MERSTTQPCGMRSCDVLTCIWRLADVRILFDTMHYDIAIRIDHKGAWRNNVFVERLWRSVKYEEVYRPAYESVSEAPARSAVTSTSTMAGAHIPGLTARDPIKPTSRPLALTPAGAPLIVAENLFRQSEPPLFDWYVLFLYGELSRTSNVREHLYLF